MTQAPQPSTPPEVTRARTERIARRAFVGFLVIAIAFGAQLALRRGDGFPIGSCLRGSWSDDTGGGVALVQCSEPHDYVVLAIADVWNGCPPLTIGRMPFNTGGLISKDKWQCLRAA
jgi:hypothetical protein